MQKELDKINTVIEAYEVNEVIREYNELIKKREELEGKNGNRKKTTKN